MKKKKISGSDWQGVLGLHNLFKRINEAVINNYGNTTPIQVVELILSDPNGTKGDGIVTIYPNPDSGTEYFLRMHNTGGVTVFNTDMNAMERGEGGFLKFASTLTEPDVFPDISSEITEGDLRMLPWISKMRTALVVPTVSVTGAPATTVIFAYNEDAFSADVIKFDIFLTYATTNIILNMLLRMEADRVRRALDEELASVGRIQKTFLPKGLPISESLEWAVHYATSTRAGGDYYDFFNLSGGRTGAVIADVSGHGSSAALVMAMTRLLLHTYPNELGPPETVLDNLNRLLAGNLLLGQFVTAFYCVIDPASKSVSYSNAGHCPPIHLRSVDNTVARLKTDGGMPLGIIKAGVFDRKEARVEAGDVIFFFTDGLKEAMNPSKEMYGDERIEKALTACADMGAEEIKDYVLEDMRSFCRGETIKDDLTLVVVKVMR